MKLKTGFSLWFFAFLAVIFTFLSCGSPEPSFLYREDGYSDKFPREFLEYPDTQFAHISDIHVFDPFLGTSGVAWDSYMAKDRKLLAQSAEILNTGLAQIISAGPQFIIVSGDLTKDGERLSHERVARSLAKVEAEGIDVYVIPGNHDILNPHSYSYFGTNQNKVDHITPEDFSKIYQDLGYDKALTRDSSSLSYLVEPTPGLWLLALDSAMYETNFADDYPKTEGSLRTATLRWMENILQEAQTKKKAVMVTLHHGLVEHWPGQAKFHPEYLVDHRDSIAQALAHYGVRFVLTGHYHSHDVAVKRFEKDNTWIYDLESGSLVTWPSPWRMMDIKNNRMTLTTGEVTSLPSIPDFGPFARNFVKQGLKGLTSTAANKFFVAPEDQERIAELSAEAFLNHYAGDENPPAGRNLSDTEGMGLMGKLMVWQLGYVLEGLWTDTEPSDRNITIDLKTGTWIQN